MLLELRLFARVSVRLDVCELSKDPNIQLSVDLGEGFIAY